jgi:hypothetical protein
VHSQPTGPDRVGNASGIRTGQPIGADCFDGTRLRRRPNNRDLPVKERLHVARVFLLATALHAAEMPFARLPAPPSRSATVSESRRRARKVRAELSQVSIAVRGKGRTLRGT